MNPFLIVAADLVKTGGMDRANYAMAEYLACQDREVIIVAYRVSSDLLAYRNIKFIQVPKVFNSYLLSAPILQRVGRQQAKQISQKLGRVLVNGGNCLWSDINWVHYVHAAYKPESRTGWMRSLKQTHAHHAALQDELASLKASRIIIANSRRTRQELIDKLGIPEDRIKVIYYGTDPNLFYPPTISEKETLRQRLGWTDNRKKAMFIGALSDRRKGFDTLFEAWKQLVKDPDWDVDLVVVGRGAELPLWQQRAISAGLTDHIQFLGFRNDVPDLLQAADCLVAPTRYEAYGLGVHEALCCGLPAIVSDSAGVAERYPQQLLGLLLQNPNDSEELVARLQQWRSRMTGYKHFVCSLADELRQYSWNHMAMSILKVLS